MRSPCTINSCGEQKYTNRNSIFFVSNFFPLRQSTPAHIIKTERNPIETHFITLRLTHPLILYRPFNIYFNLTKKQVAIVEKIYHVSVVKKKSSIGRAGCQTAGTRQKMKFFSIWSTGTRLLVRKIGPAYILTIIVINEMIIDLRETLEGLKLKLTSWR